jgi:hypothetical protein
MIKVNLFCKTKKEKKYMKALEEKVKYWGGILQLSSWKIDLYVEDKVENKENGLTVAAHISPNSVYQSAKLVLYTESYVQWKKNPSILDEIISHELTHCLLDRLQMLCYSRFISESEVKEEVEHKVQLISRILQSLAK